MDREYFREYYQLERNHWWFRVRSQIIDQHINKYFSQNGNLKILNIGVATGATTELLEKYGEVISIEYDRTCSIETHKKINKPVINGSINNLPFVDNFFDLVCAFDVIEHVEDDANAVNEMKRVCKKEGIVCITVPAYMFLWSNHDVVNNHHRRYRLNKLNSLFTGQNEGKVLYKSYFNSLLFPAIATFRLFSKIFPESLVRKGAGSDFTVLDNDSPVNSLLFSIFSLEKKLLNILKLPFGTSILLSWQKL